MMTVDAKESLPCTMADLLSLVERDIPEGRQNLKDSFCNLEKVADYCESNYLQSDNKRAALEETKNYTTQSLASVAYQINTLAYNLMNMLDLQSAQMVDMEGQINHISQRVAIHKEKVARREIGILTVNKVNPRQHKVYVPANPERPVKYVRKPIDFAILDDVGHGVRLPHPQHHHLHSGGSSTLRTKRASLTGEKHQVLGPYMSPAPTTKPPTPPQGQLRAGMGSLSRGSKEYRTPAPPIAPPQVPSHYAPNYPLGHVRSGMDTISRRAGQPGYSASSVAQQQMQPGMTQYVSGMGPGSQSTLMRQQNQMMAGAAPQPLPLSQGPGVQVGMVHPMAQHQQQQMQQQQQIHQQQHHHPAPPPPVMSQRSSMSMSQPSSHEMPSPTPTPPPPPPPGHEVHPSPSIDSLPEPPSHLRPTSGSFDRNVSPPLPPPPGMADESGAGSGSGQVVTGTPGDWIPKTYLEKVIAIYDYSANRFDELSFQDNSVIYVIKKNDDGWYEGVLDGITGLFPGNYVEPCL